MIGEEEISPASGVFCVSACCWAQTGDSKQKANHVQCGNVIVKDNGPANLTCSGLTKAQAKLLENTIPAKLENLITADYPFSGIPGACRHIVHAHFCTSAASAKVIGHLRTSQSFLLSRETEDVVAIKPFVASSK